MSIYRSVTKVIRLKSLSGSSADPFMGVVIKRSADCRHQNALLS
jgi:hypothetical protein